jgi:hypothetical protein
MIDVSFKDTIAEYEDAQRRRRQRYYGYLHREDIDDHVQSSYLLPPKHSHSKSKSNRDIKGLPIGHGEQFGYHHNNVNDYHTDYGKDDDYDSAEDDDEDNDQTGHEDDYNDDYGNSDRGKMLPTFNVKNEAAAARRYDHSRIDDETDANEAKVSPRQVENLEIILSTRSASRLSPQTMSGQEDNPIDRNVKPSTITTPVDSAGQDSDRTLSNRVIDDDPETVKEGWSSEISMDIEDTKPKMSMKSPSNELTTQTMASLDGEDPPDHVEATMGSQSVGDQHDYYMRSFDEGNVSPVSTRHHSLVDDSYDGQDRHRHLNDALTDDDDAVSNKSYSPHSSVHSDNMWKNLDDHQSLSVEDSFAMIQEYYMRRSK